MYHELLILNYHKVIRESSHMTLQKLNIHVSWTTGKFYPSLQK